MSSPPSREELQRALFGRVGRTSKRVGPEAPIQKAVLQFLNLLPGCHAWRQNTGGAKFLGAHGERYWVQFGQPGMADISGILHGYRLEVEVKAPGNKPTPIQAAWLEHMKASGAVAFWCDSLDGCIEELKTEHERRKWPWTQ